MRGFRAGIVNPRTPFGIRVRQLLSEGRLPVVELKLFEADAVGEASLTRFQDEVVVTQAVDPALFPSLDVLFFAGNDSDLWNRVAGEAAAASVLTFIEGAIGLEGPVAAPGLNDTSLSPESGPVIVPRASSYLLGVTLRRLRSALSLSGVRATVLVPTGARGAAGADELHQQTVSLLNFKELPTEVFGGQVAFNVRLAGEETRAPFVAEAVAREASELAGLEEVLTVSLVQVPVFHAFAASVWVEIGEPVEPKTLVSCFREPPFAIETGRTAKSPSPASVSAAESNKIHVGGIRRPTEVSRPGFWLWLVADSTAYDEGLAAVELAKKALS